MVDFFSYQLCKLWSLWSCYRSYILLWPGLLFVSGRIFSLVRIPTASSTANCPLPVPVGCAYFSTAAQKYIYIYIKRSQSSFMFFQFVSVGFVCFVFMLSMKPIIPCSIPNLGLYRAPRLYRACLIFIGTLQPSYGERRQIVMPRG